MDIATNAAEAYERYAKAYAADALIQGAWHKEMDGRRLACALGVLGDGVETTRDCPATVMPRWLAQMVPWLFDRQTTGDAKAWGLAFYAELMRLDGNVPFSVVYDWHASAVCPLGIEVAEKLGYHKARHKVIQALHVRALNGDPPPEDEWRHEVRNADALAFAAADAETYAYASVTGYAYAEANTAAYVEAAAAAYVDANPDANDADYAEAQADASAIKRLADGMVECLRRVA